MISSLGYPLVLLVLFLAVGIPLALFRPFAAFLLSIFITMSANFSMMTFTRMPGLDEFFNAHDACLLVAALAALVYSLKTRRIFIHPLVVPLVLVLLIGAFISLSYVTDAPFGANSASLLRPLRWALTFPIYLLCGAWIIDSPSRMQQFLLVVFIASVTAAFHHFVHILSVGRVFSSNNIPYLRTVFYTQSAGIVFVIVLLAGGNLPVIFGRKNVRGYLFTLGCAAIAVSYLLTQTRSILIAAMVALALSIVIRAGASLVLDVLLRLTLGGLVVVIAVLTFGQVSGQFDFTPIVGRLGSLEDVSRANALRSEYEDWLASPESVIVGNGLAYFAMTGEVSLTNPNEMVAWGHLGYITTLSQFGVFGFLIYYFVLPVAVFATFVKLRRRPDEAFYGFSSLVFAYTVYVLVLHALSGSFLQQQTAIYGLLFGCAWRVAQVPAAALNSALPAPPLAPSTVGYGYRRKP
jgi:hypothetical protein